MDIRAAEAFRDLAASESGTVGALLRQIAHSHEQVPISESTDKRYLNQMDFTYKRYRYSSKKRNREAFEYASK